MCTLLVTSCGHLKKSAQRLDIDLRACGRAWILFGSRKTSKPEKCLKMPQNPTRQAAHLDLETLLCHKR